MCPDSDADPSTAEQPKEQTIYDQVIKNLDDRIVSQPTRGKLRKALDKADTPTHEEKINDAFKRITGV